MVYFEDSEMFACYYIEIGIEEDEPVDANIMDSPLLPIPGS